MRSKLILGIWLVWLMFGQMLVGCAPSVVMDHTEKETEETEISETSAETTSMDQMDWDAYQAYVKSYEIGSTSPHITEKSISWYANIDGSNMSEEQIVFDWSYMDSATPAMFAVLDSTGMVVYCEEPATAHAGWTSYYLYENEWGQYLLRYIPYVGNGGGEFCYEVLNIGSSGTLEVIQEESVEFMVGSGAYITDANSDWKMNLYQMDYFAECVNELLETSYLLFSTDQDWLGNEIAASETGMFVIGNLEEPYCKRETYQIFEREAMVADPVKLAEITDVYDKLKAWCDAEGVPYIDREAKLRQYKDYTSSYEVGNTHPQITKDSTIWEADLTHDGIVERIVFDWSLFESGFGGMLAVLDAQGSVLFSAELITDHGFSQTYYLCNHEGKAYIFRYKPYSMQGEQSYDYELFYLTEHGDKIVESEQMIHFSNQEWPGAANEDGKRVMNIPEMVEFAETVNGYLEDSYLLVSTDHDFVGAWFQGEEGEYISYVLGSEEDPHRAREVYDVFHDPDVVPEVAQIEDIAEKLKTWCEKTGIPYQE